MADAQYSTQVMPQYTVQPMHTQIPSQPAGYTQPQAHVAHAHQQHHHHQVPQYPHHHHHGHQHHHHQHQPGHHHHHHHQHQHQHHHQQHQPQPHHHHHHHHQPQHHHQHYGQPAQHFPHHQQFQQMQGAYGGAVAPRYWQPQQQSPGVPMQSYPDASHLPPAARAHTTSPSLPQQQPRGAVPPPQPQAQLQPPSPSVQQQPPMSVAAARPGQGPKPAAVQQQPPQATAVQQQPPAQSAAPPAAAPEQKKRMLNPVTGQPLDGSKAAKSPAAPTAEPVAGRVQPAKPTPQPESEAAKPKPAEVPKTGCGCKRMKYPEHKCNAYCMAKEAMLGCDGSCGTPGEQTLPGRGGGAGRMGNGKARTGLDKRMRVQLSSLARQEDKKAQVAQLQAGLPGATQPRPVQAQAAQPKQQQPAQAQQKQPAQQAQPQQQQPAAAAAQQSPPPAQQQPQQQPPQQPQQQPQQQPPQQQPPQPQQQSPQQVQQPQQPVAPVPQSLPSPFGKGAQPIKVTPRQTPTDGPARNAPTIQPKPSMPLHQQLPTQQQAAQQPAPQQPAQQPQAAAQAAGGAGSRLSANAPQFMPRGAGLQEQPQRVRIEPPAGHPSAVDVLPDGSVQFTQRPPDVVEVQDGRHYSFEDIEERGNLVLQNFREHMDTIPELVKFMNENTKLWKEDWRPTSPAKLNHVMEAGRNADADEKVRREVRGLVNKMTPEKYAKLKAELGTIVSTIVREQEEQLKQMIAEREQYRRDQGCTDNLTEEEEKKEYQRLVDSLSTGKLGSVVKIAYEAAVTQDKLTEMYADLCRDIAVCEASSRSVSATGQGANVTVGKAWFRRYLVNHCQQQFEELRQDNERRAKRKRQGHEMSAEEQQSDKKCRERAVGNIRFVGELFKRTLLTEKIMHSILKLLLNGNGADAADGHPNADSVDVDEEQLVTMAKLLSTIGKELDTAKAAQYMNFYMQCLESLSKNERICLRVRFVLQNVVELRKNDWKQKEGEKALSLQAFENSHERRQREKTLNLGWTAKQVSTTARPAPAVAAPPPPPPKQDAEHRSPRQSAPSSPTARCKPQQRAQDDEVRIYESRARELIAAAGTAEHPGGDFAMLLEERGRERDLRLVLIHGVLGTSKTVKMQTERDAVVKILRLLRDPPQGSGLARAAEEVASWGGVRTILADAAFEVLYGGLCEDSPRLLSLFVNFIQELLAPKDPHTALLTDWSIADIVAHAICGASPAAASSGDQPWKLVGKLLNELANLLRVHHSVMPSCRTAPSIVLLGDSDIAMKVVAEECKGADPSLMVCRKFQAAGEDEKVFESIKGEDEKVKLGQDGHCSAVVAGILAHLWLCGKDEGNWSGFFRKRPGSEQEAVKKLIVFYCSGREAAVQKECACFVARAEPAGPETHSSAVQFAREFVAWCRSQHIKLKAPTDLDDDLRAALARLDAR